MELDGCLTPLLTMECRTVREVLSAQLDQEAGDEEAAAANRHLGQCPGCAQWWTSAGAVARTLRVRPAEVVPDIATAALNRSRNERRWPYQSARAALAVLAAVELVFAVSGVVAGRDASPIHDTQHLGAFGAAIAAAVLVAALRPALARGMMPIALTLGIAIPIFAVVDLANGNLTTGGGIHHIVQMIGVALVWIVSTTRVAPASDKSTRTLPEAQQAARPIAAVRSQR